MIDKKHKRLSKYFYHHRFLIIAYGLFITIYLITRLPYFIHYPVVIFDLDDGAYYQIADQISKGTLPYLNIRTPGYPIMIWLILSIFQYNFAIILFQHFLTFFAALFFIYALNFSFQNYRILPIFASLSVSAYISSGIHTLSDSQLMTDSPFASFLMIVLASLILGLHKKSTFLLFCASFLMAWTILVRPAGMFLIAIYLLVLFYFFQNRFRISRVLAFAIPLPALLLLLMSYNLFTIGSFAVSTFSEHSLISITSTFLVQDDSLGPAAKTAALRCHENLTEEEKSILRNSWDYAKVNRILVKYFETNRVVVAESFFEFEDPQAYDLYLKWRPIWRKMALNAIRTHPKIALKYFYSNVIFFFRHGIQKDHNYYDILPYAFIMSHALREHYSVFADPKSFFNRRFINSDYAQLLSEDFTRFMLREYYTPFEWKYFDLHEGGNTGELVPTNLLRLHQAYIYIHRPVFRNNLWILSFFLVFGFSMIQVTRTRARHFGSFSLFMLCFLTLLYGIFISFSAYPYLRYTYTLEYIYYLAPFLVPIAFKKKDKSL